MNDAYSEVATLAYWCLFQLVFEMTRAQVLQNAIAISRKRHELSVTSDWRYPRFLDFLQISPSYRLAHLIAKGAVKRSDQPLPADFQQVERTYAAFGDVTHTYFWDWWLRTAQYQFGVSLKPEARVLLKLNLRQQPTENDIGQAQAELADHLFIDRPAQGNQATIVVALPVHNDRKTMLKAFERLLDQTYGLLGQQEGLAPFSVQRNKMREHTLRMALKVLRARAALPNERLFIIGNRANVSPANMTGEQRSRIDGEGKGKRRQMEIMTIRHLNRAYVLAENAARGLFPSLAPLAEDPHRPVFDYHLLKRQFKDYLRWGEAEKKRLQAIAGKRRKAKKSQ